VCFAYILSFYYCMFIACLEFAFFLGALAGGSSPPLGLSLSCVHVVCIVPILYLLFAEDGSRPRKSIGKFFVCSGASHARGHNIVSSPTS